MKGDFSRDTYDPRKHFSRVLMQQGRVQLDSDWNEQADIVLHYLRTLALDVFGPHGGPGGSSLGFAITDVTNKNFKIGKGHYYVDGILCENDSDCWYQTIPNDPAFDTRQPYFIPDEPDRYENLSGSRLLVYLDAWEQYISYAEDPSILEPALNGVDTAARARIVWQARLLQLAAGDAGTCDELIKKLPAGKAKLKARLDPATASTDVCIQSPESRYRGAENQLYRVEVHDGSGPGHTPTFKWSRNNGAEIFPVTDMSGAVVTLGSAGRSGDLQENDWVEYGDDGFGLGDEAGPLLQVASVDPVEMKVTLKTDGRPLPDYDAEGHAYLRRWDQKGSKKLPLVDGAVRISESGDDTGWINLEDGLQIQFQPGGVYRTGDYWLIPARVTTGRIEWPLEGGKPAAVDQRGVAHHYAPLAMLASGAAPEDCRCSVVATRTCPPGP